MPRGMGRRAYFEVGIDLSSPDHVLAVQSEFPGVDVVNAPLRRIPGLIVKGEIDATVWKGGMAVKGKYINLLKIMPATVPEIQTLAQTLAVLVAKQGSTSFRLLSTPDKKVLDEVYVLNTNL